MIKEALEDNRMLNDLEFELEKTRQALAEIIEIRYINGFDDEIIQLSQYMDILLVKFMKEKGYRR
mgnify:CR=1 FL=1